MQQVQKTANGLRSGDMGEAEEAVAAAIHETWRALARKEGWRMQEHLDRPYAELAANDKEDNRAAARRIPQVLALVGLALHQAEDGAPTALTSDELKARIEQNLERLAEAEHDGWMAQRRRTGWRWAAERDDARKLHPAMLPYAELPEREKGKDRNSVRHYPDFAACAGYELALIR